MSASMWPLSRVPFLDQSGAPYVGALLYFYNEGTTTPQTVYSDAALSQVIDQSQGIAANSRGQWPAIYLNANPGAYRQRATDATGSTVLFDDDGIAVYQSATYVPPSAGSTDTTLLFATGDVKARHSTGVHTGWVRCNGRTIGDASSSATERANADTSALFTFLWGADSTLAVSGGRGANAASDYSAHKTIALPDYRERVLAGLADMGNTAGSLLSGNTVDNSETTSTLGATLGAGTHTLTTTEMPSHSHTFTGDALTAHSHTFGVFNQDAGGGVAADGQGAQTANASTSSVSAGTPTGTNSNTGGGGAHANAQPSVLITWYIKL
jgi:microcystin-dependent protein